MYRTHNNGELRLQDVNSEVTLCGWVAKRRNFGALVFIDLRDRYGITQLVFNEDIATQISDVRNEYVLQVKGTVVERKDKNPKLATGEIEVVVREVKIVNTAITTPMIIRGYSFKISLFRFKKTSSSKEPNLKKPYYFISS